MRLTIFFFLMFVLMPVLQGQTAEEKVIQLKEEHQTTGEEEPVVRTAARSSWNLSMGTSYSFMQGYGSGMALYAAPMLTMPLNQRWSLHGGMIVSQYYRMGAQIPGEGGMPGAFSGLALFAAASYQMNDRLVLHGTGTKQLVSTPLVSPFSPYSLDDLSFGATYKVGNNLTIGATIHMKNGNGIYHTPFRSGGFHTPYFW